MVYAIYDRVNKRYIYNKNSLFGFPDLESATFYNTEKVAIQIAKGLIKQYDNDYLHPIKKPEFEILPVDIKALTPVAIIKESGRIVSQEGFAIKMATGNKGEVRYWKKRARIHRLNIFNGTPTPETVYKNKEAAKKTLLKISMELWKTNGFAVEAPMESDSAVTYIVTYNYNKGKGKVIFTIVDVMEERVAAKNF